MTGKQENLKPGSNLDKYRIKQVLGGGGFSIVYLATESESESEMVIKEYFPAKLASRHSDLTVRAVDEKSETLFSQGRKLFFQEASILASMDHPNIVKVRNFFHANNTIYTVMDYDKGISLQAFIKKEKGSLGEKLILAIFIPLLESLKTVHEKGLLHLDIKPGNIFLRKGVNPLLLDFGAIHKLAMSADSRFFPVVSHGFSPPEQTCKNANLGPWSDIYAIGASMRACIEAKPPPAAKLLRKKEAIMIPAADVLIHLGYSSDFLKCIDWAMQLEIAKRPQQVLDFLEKLKAA